MSMNHREPETLNSEPSLLNVRILLVDDSDIYLEVTRSILELEGALVRVANNGLEAFEFLKDEPDSVDLVLMDIQMPVLNGHDATERIRAELRLPNLPIIALTAAARSSDLHRAAEVGMNDYLIKPYEPLDLLRCILRHAKPSVSRSVEPMDSAWHAEAEQAHNGDRTIEIF
jgi:CheY-like chemotaxis protein